MIYNHLYINKKIIYITSSFGNKYLFEYKNKKVVLIKIKGKRKGEKMKTQKILIVGIMALFIISSVNPLFVQNVKANPINDLTLVVNPAEQWECNDFTVTVKNSSGKPIPAYVTYNFADGALGSLVTFEAHDVSAAKNVPVKHTITAECEFDSDGDGLNETHRGEASVYVKNRYLEITSKNPSDGENFDVHVEEVGNYKKIDGDADVSINFPSSQSRKTGPTGNTVLPFKAPVHTKEEPGLITYTITATKDDFISADPVELHVKNINLAPSIPSKPSAPGLDVFIVGKPITISTSSDDPDQDQIRYKFFWGDGSSEWSDYKNSGNTASLQHTYTMQVPGLPKKVTIKTKAEDNGLDENKNSDTKTSLTKSLGQDIWIKNNAPSFATVSGESDFSDTSIVTLRFKGEDPDDHDVRFRINWGDDTDTTGWMSSPAIEDISHTYDQAGQYSVSMTVDDKYGKSKSSNSHSIVVGNLPPRKPSLSVSKMGIGTGAVQATATTTDPNKDDTFTLYINWGDGSQSSKEGLGAGGGNGFTEGHTYSSGGLKTITAWAEDNHEPSARGQSARKRVFLVVFNALAADAAMPINIDVTPQPIPIPISNMIPKTFINENGEVERIDPSFSVNSYQDGTYSLQQYGTTVQQGLSSVEEVQNYAATYVPSDNNDDEDSGSDSNNNDDNSDDSNEDDQDDSEDSEEDEEDDSEDSEEDEEGEPESYPTVYSILDYQDPFEWVDTVDGDGQNIGDDETTKEDSTDKETEDENTNAIEVTVQFDGSGTLVPLCAQADQEIETDNGLIEIQSNQKLENSRVAGISSLFEKFLEFLTTLSKLDFIQDILKEETENLGDNQNDVAIEEENTVEDVSDTNPINTDDSENEETTAADEDEHSGDSNSENSISDEEGNTEVNDQDDLINEETPNTDDVGEDLVVNEETIEGLLEQDNIVFLWDFGDGTAGTGMKTTHTYTINVATESTEEKDKETAIDRFCLNSFNEIPKEAIDIIEETDENSGLKHATYQVRLFIVVDEQGVLENIESIDKTILSQVEIISQDTTTVTIGEFNTGPSLDGVVEQVEIDGIGVYSQLSLLHF